VSGDIFFTPQRFALSVNRTIPMAEIYSSQHIVAAQNDIGLALFHFVDFYRQYGALIGGSILSHRNTSRGAGYSGLAGTCFRYGARRGREANQRPFVDRENANRGERLQGHEVSREWSRAAVGQDGSMAAIF
jgi:hypothetical protein